MPRDGRDLETFILQTLVIGDHLNPGRIFQNRVNLSMFNLQLSGDKEVEMEKQLNKTLVTERAPSKETVGASPHDPTRREGDAWWRERGDCGM